MSQHYSNPWREDDPYSLPDVEVFYMEASEFTKADKDTWIAEGMKEEGGSATDLEGWYYWYCLPGCLPDSNPMGPYNTKREALEAAREDYADDVE